MTPDGPPDPRDTWVVQPEPEVHYRAPAWYEFSAGAIFVVLWISTAISAQKSRLLVSTPWGWRLGVGVFLGILVGVPLFLYYRDRWKKFVAGMAVAMLILLCIGFTPRGWARMLFGGS